LPRLRRRIFERVLDDLVARRGDEVDVERVGEFDQIDQGVGDLVADRGKLLGRRPQALLAGLMWKRKCNFATLFV